MRLFILIALWIFAGTESSSACPNPQLNGSLFGYYADDLYQPQAFPAVAGGSYRIPPCNLDFWTDEGDGYVTERPDFTIEVIGLKGYELEFRTESNCDSVLVVNTGLWNWYYDDDDNRASARDALIRFNLPVDGVYDVWIGSLDGYDCDARLIVETFYK